MPLFEGNFKFKLDRQLNTCQICFEKYLNSIFVDLSFLFLITTVLPVLFHALRPGFLFDNPPGKTSADEIIFNAVIVTQPTK